MALIAFLMAFSPLTRPEREIITPDEMYHRHLDAALTGKVKKLIEGGLIMKANWMADGNSFWYAEGPPENTVIYTFNPQNKKKIPLFDTPRLRRSLSEKLG